MKLVKAALMGALLSVSAPLSAMAQDLVLSSWLPPRHPVVINAIKPWAKQVKEVTEGRVNVRVLAKPLGSPPAHFDMARDGVADITYGLHSFTKDDRFKKARIGQFSFLGDDAVKSSEAFWTVYNDKLGARDEHKGTQLLGLFMHGPGLFHNNKTAINKLEDFSGLKIRVPGGYIPDLLKGYGVEPVFMSSGEIYEKLSRGVVDGVTITYEAITSFKLTDYITNTTTFPGGLYNTTWFLVMNEDKWNGISEADRKAIEGISGLAFAKLVGKAWNDADAKAIGVMKKAGIKIAPAPDAVVDSVRARAAELEGAWADSLGGDYDGRAALKDFRSMTGVGK